MDVALTKRAGCLRIVTLKPGQRNEVALKDGRRVAWTVRKVRGRLQLEVDTFPDGTRILTTTNAIK